MKKYTPEKCECCGQSTTYVLAIDKGTVDIVKAIAKFIEKKGINVVHPRKEIEGNGLDSNQVGNLSRPRFHGLIAKVKGNPGNYCLTRKGAAFLKGEPIKRFAIVSKAQKMNIGYWGDEECTIKEITGAYWEGINYDIQEGRVVRDLPQREPLSNRLF